MILANTALEVSSWFTVVSVMMAILGAAAFIGAYAKTNFARNTISLQGEQIKAQSQRIETLEEDVERAEKKRLAEYVEHERIVTEMRVRITSLETAIKVLENVKTGADAVEQLAKSVNNMFVDTTGRLEKNSKKLEEIYTFIKVK